MAACMGGQGTGGGGRSFSTLSKTVDLSALGTTGSCPAGEEDDKICAKLQNFVHVRSVGVFLDLVPRRNTASSPPRSFSQPVSF